MKEEKVPGALQVQPFKNIERRRTKIEFGSEPKSSLNLKDLSLFSDQEQGRVNSRKRTLRIHHSQYSTTA